MPSKLKQMCGKMQIKVQRGLVKKMQKGYDISKFI